MPCAGGHRLDLDAAPPPDIDSRRQLVQEKAELKQLENARHKQEAKGAKEGQRATRAFAVKQKKCATLARRQKWANEDAARATLKTAEKAKRKARRAEEVYQAECSD